ncbi:zinc finger, CCHC-type containing protein [Tanacetum coccineum]
MRLHSQYSVFKHIMDFEEFMNVFMRIGFGSTIELVSFDKIQVVAFDSKFVSIFRNSDCETRSQSDNMVTILSSGVVVDYFFDRMELFCFVDEVFDSEYVQSRHDAENSSPQSTPQVFPSFEGTKSYPVGIVKDVEVHIGKLKLLNDFYVTNMKKDPETLLLVGRGFLATANAFIDCRMAKIAVRKGITRSVFGVKGVDLGEEEAPYWTTLAKKESYKPRPSSDGVGAQTPYYARKDFLDCHLPGE